MFILNTSNNKEKTWWQVARVHRRSDMSGVMSCFLNYETGNPAAASESESFIVIVLKLQQEKKTL